MEKIIGDKHTTNYTFYNELLKGFVFINLTNALHLQVFFGVYYS